MKEHFEYRQNIDLMCPTGNVPSAPYPLRNIPPSLKESSSTDADKTQFNSDTMRRWLRSPEIRCFKSEVDEYGYI